MSCRCRTMARPGTSRLARVPVPAAPIPLAPNPLPNAPAQTPAPTPAASPLPGREGGAP